MSTYQIDPAHSSAQFKVRHLMISNVKGEFDKVIGTVNYDPANPSASTVDATIEVASISTRDEQRDAHLKSPDFFDVAQFPTITFKSKKIVKKGKQLEVTGDFTMHGVTRPVTFTVEPPAKQQKDPWGNTRTAATGVARLNRTDYGLKWNKVIEGGGNLVGEDVAIGISLELVEKK